ncbi:hypothetical protein [Streptomyces sp. NPDC004721]
MTGQTVTAEGITNNKWVRLPLNAVGVGYVSGIYLRGDEASPSSAPEVCTTIERGDMWKDPSADVNVLCTCGGRSWRVWPSMCQEQERTENGLETMLAHLPSSPPRVAPTAGVPSTAQAVAAKVRA